MSLACVGRFSMPEGEIERLPASTRHDNAPNRRRRIPKSGRTSRPSILPTLRWRAKGRNRAWPRVSARPTRRVHFSSKTARMHEREKDHVPRSRRSASSWSRRQSPTFPNVAVSCGPSSIGMISYLAHPHIGGPPALSAFEGDG
jgi:hypothetical protein